MFGQKYKPAVRGVTKLDAPEQDFQSAQEFGSLRVGEQALYIEDISILYIPLQDIARLEIDVQAEQGGTCCNMTSVTTHDVTLVTTGGGSRKVKVVNACKALEALRRVKALNNAVEVVCTGDTAVLRTA